MSGTSITLLIGNLYVYGLWHMCERVTNDD